MAKIISNEEFEKALNNAHNKSIMECAASNFYSSLHSDEIYRCKLVALWETLQSWRPNGKKFTSFLYQKVRWECLKIIYKQKKDKKCVLMANIEKGYEKNENINEMVECLSPELRELVEKRFVQKMTLTEIASQHKMCPETVRKRILHATDILRKKL